MKHAIPAPLSWTARVPFAASFFNFVQLTLGLVSVFLILCVSSAPAGEGVVGRRDLVLAISIDENGRGYAVGNKGLMLTTRNSGDTWTRLEIGTLIAFNDVATAGDHAWIVGQNGTVLHAMIDGESWAQQPSPVEASLMQVTFLDERKGFIVGEGGTALTTDDGGATWRLVALDWTLLLPEDVIMMGVVAPNLYDIFFVDREKGWIVGDSGLVLSTADGGATWMRARAGLEPPLFSVFFENAEAGWATGQNGLLLKTVDGGATWTSVYVPTGASLYRIVMSNGFGLIAGDQGTILRTDDGGSTWSPVPLTMPPPLPWIGDIKLIPGQSERRAVVSGWGVLNILTIPAS